MASILNRGKECKLVRRGSGEVFEEYKAPEAGGQSGGWQGSGRTGGRTPVRRLLQ